MSRCLLFAFVVGVALCGRHCPASDRPNVLLVITDEHNFRTLGCYRKQMHWEQAEMWGRGATVPTPHIDRIAEQGVLCTRAYATSPVCSPCRAAMITGRYPHATGVSTNNMVLDRSVPTLADRLNGAGYRSAFIGKWHLGGDGKPEWAPKVDGGFSFKKFMFNRGHWKKFGIDSGNPIIAARRSGKPSYDVAGADEKSFSTDWLTDRALDFMLKDDEDKPFLTVISYPDPHGPNTVRPPYDHRFDDLPFQPPRTYKTGLPEPKWIAQGGKHPVFRGDNMSKYFGMVQCIDDNIGRIVEQLKKAGQWDNTLFVLTSDHGDLCYEHDRQNKGNPYEGSARVPLIFRSPRQVAAGEVYHSPVGTVDITPTLISLLGMPADSSDHGRDLSEHLVATDRKSPQGNEITFLRNSGTSAQWVAAIDARYKLILSLRDDPWLFDNQSDPDELLNYYGRPGSKEPSQRLAKAMQQHAKQVEDPYYENARIKASLSRVLGNQ